MGTPIETKSVKVLRPFYFGGKRREVGEEIHRVKIHDALGYKATGKAAIIDPSVPAPTVPEESAFQQGGSFAESKRKEAKKS